MLRNIYRGLAKKVSWEQKITLSDPARRDIEWWLSALTEWNGTTLVPESIDIQLTTDASGSGWGAFIPGKEAAGFWDRSMSKRPSNTRELMAVLMGMLSLVEDLKGHSVQVLSDNVTTCAYINHMRGSSIDLHDIATSIWACAAENNILLSAHYIAGKNNQKADALSRLPVCLEWKLHPAMFRILDRRWGPHTIDRFATMCNTQLPVYNSRLADPLSAGIDALAQADWASHNNYVNAPFRLLSRILRVIKEQGATATVIAPWWTAQPWFNVLQELSVEDPIPLPRHKRLFWSPTRECVPEPSRNRRWRTFAWRICGKKNTKDLGGVKMLANNLQRV
jgi:hypothetical protein